MAEDNGKTGGNNNDGNTPPPTPSPEGGTTSSFLEQLKDGIVDSSKTLLKTLSEGMDTMTSTMKNMMQKEDLNREKDKASKAKENLRGFPLPKEQPDPIETENKKGFRKLFKTKYFDNILKGLQGLLASAGSSFMEMIEFFLFMAFVDPNGSLLKSLIKIFFSIFKMILKIIIELLPTAINMMLEAGILIVDLIVAEFPTLFNALLDAFAKIGEVIIKKFPGLTHILQPIIDFFKGVKESFAQLQAGNKTISQFLMDIVIDAFKGIAKSIWGAFFGEETKDAEGKGRGDGGSAVKGIATASIAFALLWKVLKPLMPILKHVGTLFGWIGDVMSYLNKKLNLIPKILNGISKGFSMLTNVIRTFMMFLVANPIVAIVLAVIAGLVLIWVFKDKIVAFFEGIYEWFMGFWTKLSTPMKLLVGLLMLPLLPIILLGVALWGLAKAFQWLASLDWDTIFNDLITWFTDLPGKFMEGFWTLNDDMGKWWDDMGKDVSQLGSDINSGMNNAYTSFLNFFPNLWKGVDGWLEKDLPELWKKFTIRVMKLLDMAGVSEHWKRRIKAFLDGIKEIFTLANILRGMSFSELGNLLSEGLKDGLRTVFRFFSEGIEMVIAMIRSSDAGRWLFGEGRVSANELRAINNMKEQIESSNLNNKADLLSDIEQLKAGNLRDTTRLVEAGFSQGDLNKLASALTRDTKETDQNVVDAINRIADRRVIIANSPNNLRTSS